MVIVYMFVNSTKLKMLMLHFVPMFTIFWLKCPKLDSQMSNTLMRDQCMIKISRHVLAALFNLGAK